MNSQTLNQIVTLVKEWNKALQIQLAEEMGETPDLFLTPEMKIALRNSVMNSLQGWGDDHAPNLIGRSLAEVTNEIVTCDDGWQVFCAVAQYCDTEMPEFLTLSLGRFGLSFVDRLENAIQNYGLGDLPEEKDQSIRLMAIHLLGQWQDLRFYEELLNLYMTLDVISDSVHEAIYEYGLHLGEMAVPILYDVLSTQRTAAKEGRVAIGTSHEYGMMNLAALGALAPLPGIYELLRDLFKLMPRKIMGVLAFGELADSRAVTLLRHFLINHGHSQDRQVIYEAVDVIKRLGGQINDLPIPAPDRSNR